MPVHRRGEAWEVEVNWRGVRYRRSSRHWNRDQASEVERKLLNDLHAESVGRKPRRTFNDAVQKWVAEELPHYRDPARERAHMRALAPHIEGRYLDEAPEIARKLKADSKTKRGTLNRRLALMRRLLNLAWKDWDWLDEPLGQKIALLHDRGERHVYATEAQAHRLARLCPRAGGYVLLAAYTGVRRGQLLRLTRADVARVPRIGECLTLGTDGKTGRPQLVPLHPAVRAIAKRLPLCTSQILRDEWSAARRRAGLTHLRFNDLRHTAASWLLHSGADLMHVRDLLGHSDVRVTQRYAHLQIQHLSRAVRRIPATMGVRPKAGKRRKTL